LKIKSTSIEDLYNNKLPEIRSELKKKRLKQIGYIKIFTLEEFNKRKYDRMTNFKHSPYEPIAFTDSTLSYFEPKKFSQNLPPPTQDDKIREAIENLKLDFYLDKEKFQSGEPISFNFIVKNNSNFQINLKLVISIYDPFQNIINQKECIYNNLKKENIFNDKLILSTIKLKGNFYCLTRVYLMIDVNILIHSFNTINIFFND
jgi:hypothetical protein